MIRAVSKWNGFVNEFFSELDSSTFADGLKQSTTIQKAKAVFLVLVLILSIAPKAFFHDIVASHKDLPACSEVHKSAVFHHQGYNCHFDDLVVTTPFLFTNEQPAVVVHLYFGKIQPSSHSPRLAHFSQHKENRGPPLA